MKKDIATKEDPAKENPSSVVATVSEKKDSKTEVAVLPTKPASKKTPDLTTSLTQLGAGKTSLDLSKNLRMVGLFMAFMFVLLIGALTFKRMKRNAMLAGQATEDALKTLGTLTLNPKQQLNLVEVGGEKILLSVSNDSVSLISHIGQKAAEEKTLLGPATTETSNRRLLSGQAPQQKDSTSTFPDTLKALRKKAHEIEKRQTIPRGPVSRFSEAMETGERFAPKRKAESQTDAAKPAPKSQNVGKKINVKVGDDGVSKVKDNQDDAIKDVTSLIRNKLKDLPKF